MTDTSFHPLQHRVVSDADAGRRLDNFLLTRVPVPRQAVYRWIRTGQVRVNGARVRAHRKLCTGDKVRVPPHSEEARLRPDASLPEIPLPVLFEDENLLILDKPTGLAVHGGSKVPFGLIDLLRKARAAEPYLELAHRLDRGTSGCLAVARNPKTLAALQKQFRDRQVEKVYWCLACGLWQGGSRVVAQPLQVRKQHARNRKTVVSEQGRAASTRFSLLEQFRNACLLEARIFTGRTHQIRVHAQSLGHPLLGDDRYGEREANRASRAQGFRRLFLHAQALTLHHPETGQPLSVQAPLPEECERHLARLRGETTESRRHSPI